MALNFDSICRLCMAKGCPLVPIFDEEGMLSSRIMSLVPLIKLHNGDGLPSQVCRQCEYQVNTSYKFQLQCEYSNATLLQYRCVAQSQCRASEGLNAVNEEALKPSYIFDTEDSVCNFQDPFNDAPNMSIDRDNEILWHIKSGEGTSEMKVITEVKSFHGADTISKHNSVVLPGKIKYAKKDERKYQHKEVDMQTDIDKESSTNKIFTQILPLEENSKLLACHICGKMFLCKSKLKEHSTKHTGVRPYFCGTCDKRFTRQSSLNVHMLSHTGHKPHACPVCGKQFTQLSSMKNHALIHTGQKPQVCEVCGRRFARLDNLKSHVLIHTDHKSYVCEVCGKMFNKLAVLKTHARTHVERKLLCCDVCGKSFVNICSLKMHALIHSGKKPFNCDICRKSFTLKSSLKVHVQTHTGLKPHMCGLCGKSFSQSHSLKTHVVVHTGQKPFSCLVCGKHFKQRHTLKKHEGTHTT